MYGLGWDKTRLHHFHSAKMLTMALLQQLSQLMKDAVAANHLPGIAPV
jgi:hypothetical protein